MTDVAVLQLAQNAILVALKISAPILGLSLAVGLMVSIFQAATQIQESTLTFVPKIIAMVVALLVFGPWMLRVMTDYASGLLISLPNYVR
jgi:flagellar biosynthetic protein FliQ